MRKNSVKNIRINSEVQRELSRIIRNEVKDPRIHPMVSVTAVEVAPDLKTCKAYISVLGDAGALADTILGLRHAEGYIRRELAHTVNLRNTPVLTFLPDTSIAYGVNMTKKIDEVISRDEAADRAREENESEPDGEGTEDAENG